MQARKTFRDTLFIVIFLLFAMNIIIDIGRYKNHSQPIKRIINSVAAKGKKNMSLPSTLTGSNSSIPAYNQVYTLSSSVDVNGNYYYIGNTDNTRFAYFFPSGPTWQLGVGYNGGPIRNTPDGFSASGQNAGTIPLNGYGGGISTAFTFAPPAPPVPPAPINLTAVLTY